MKKLFLKIKNKSGITIVMAMLFLLVATMVISVILAASSTAAKNITYDRDQQQAYLTVSSVAQYFRDEIGNYKLEILDYDENSRDQYNGSGSDFTPLMNQFVQSVYLSSHSGSKEFSLNVACGESGKTDVVYVSYKIDGDGNVTAVFTTKYDGKNKIKYKMSISCRVHKSAPVPIREYDSSAEEWVVVGQKINWSWVKGSIVRGELQ